MSRNTADKTLGTTSEPPAAAAIWPSGDPYEFNPLDLVDVAVDEPASQSSTSQWSREDDAAGAVSGILAEDFALHADTEMQQKDGQIELRCLGATDGPEQERNDRNAADGPSCDYANPVVEIASRIIMEADMEARSIASIGGFDLHLAAGADAAIATPSDTRVL